jgi:hypothetical protein
VFFVVQGTNSQPFVSDHWSLCAPRGLCGWGAGVLPILGRFRVFWAGAHGAGGGGGAFIGRRDLMWDAWADGKGKGGNQVRVGGDGKARTLSAVGLGRGSRPGFRHGVWGALFSAREPIGGSRRRGPRGR